MKSRKGAMGSNPTRTTIQSRRFRTSRIIDRNPPVCAQFGINAWTRRAAPAALIVGIRQDLSAIDFDRSMDVRSHFAFIDRPKLRGTRQHTPARPSPRRATVRASDDVPPPQETEAGLGEQLWLFHHDEVPHLLRDAAFGQA